MLIEYIFLKCSYTGSMLKLWQSPKIGQVKTTTKLKQYQNNYKNRQDQGKKHQSNYEIKTCYEKNTTGPLCV